MTLSQKDLTLSELLTIGEFQSVLKDCENSTYALCDCFQSFTDIYFNKWLVTFYLCVCPFSDYYTWILYSLLQKWWLCGSRCTMLWLCFLLPSWPVQSWKRFLISVSLFTQWHKGYNMLNCSAHMVSLQLMVGWSADGSSWSHPGGERGLQEGQQPQEDEPGSGSLQGWPRQALRAQLCPKGITVISLAFTSTHRE